MGGKQKESSKKETLPRSIHGHVQSGNHHIFQSMSRKGNCYDNAPMENFFSVLKREIYDGYVYRNRRELVRAIENFIRYYNNDRIKEKLGGLSPKQYRERMICKTKSSKRNAYSIKSNFMGSLYRAYPFFMRICVNRRL